MWLPPSIDLVKVCLSLGIEVVELTEALLARVIASGFVIIILSCW